MEFISHSPNNERVDSNKQKKIYLNYQSNFIKKLSLKEFQFQFTKRENIDKKIMRKFRKYLKEKYKKHKNIQIISLINSQKFWSDFINQNLLPPFEYDYEEKKFKSFNTGYMLWVFEHVNSLELYTHFINENHQTIIGHFQTLHDLEETDNEFTLLKTYISNLPKVFGNHNNSIKLNSNDYCTVIFDNNNNNSFVKTNKETIIENSEKHILPSISSNNNVNKEAMNKNHNTLNISQEPKKEDNGYLSLFSTTLDIFDDITQSVNKNNLTFHSKSLACSTNELNGTITDVSDEYFDNKEEINCDSGGL